jgi:hypothetical protein
MEQITIPFESSNLGRVDFDVSVMTGDLKSFKAVRFKLDSGSDFTTIDCEDLHSLGYTNEFLKYCPSHACTALTASGDIQLQYIKNVTIKFGDREIQGCRIYFALDTQLRSLFGSDILKYFNRNINYDDELLHLTQRKKMPLLSEGETPLQIYTVEERKEI